MLEMLWLLLKVSLFSLVVVFFFAVLLSKN